MDFDQLWETTMNPQTRYLKQIEIEDAILASKTTELLMGTNAENRRIFIQENAIYANLDL
jgi:DNA gyrase subunit B